VRCAATREPVEAKKLDARHQKVCTKAGAMEWEVIISNEPKCEMVAASGFDKTWSPLRGIWDGKLGLNDAMPRLPPPVVPARAEAA
jgi:hypothetical protein